MNTTRARMLLLLEWLLEGRKLTVEYIISGNRVTYMLDENMKIREVSQNNQGIDIFVEESYEDSDSLSLLRGLTWNIGTEKWFAIIGELAVCRLNPESAMVVSGSMAHQLFSMARTGTVSKDGATALKDAGLIEFALRTATLTEKGAFLSKTIEELAKKASLE